MVMTFKQFCSHSKLYATIRCNSERIQRENPRYWLFAHTPTTMVVFDYWSRLRRLYDFFKVGSEVSFIKEIGDIDRDVGARLVSLGFGVFF